jgi:hypothetical protein
MSTGLAQSISSLYFMYQAVAGHAEGCPRAGTDLWEATRFTWEGLDGEIRETTLRFACFECGVVAFEMIDGPVTDRERTHCSQVGFGSKPESVAGLWLHPGPRLSLYGEDPGPLRYLVTLTSDRPRQPDDVAGIVGWTLGKRGGVHWGAGLGVTDYGTAKRGARQDFGSRRAAVAWIAAQLAGEGQ